MVCVNCGKTLEDGSRFCNQCGAEQEQIDSRFPRFSYDYLTGIYENIKVSNEEVEAAAEIYNENVVPVEPVKRKTRRVKKDKSDREKKIHFTPKQILFMITGLAVVAAVIFMAIHFSRAKEKDLFTAKAEEYLEALCDGSSYTLKDLCFAEEIIEEFGTHGVPVSTIIRQLNNKCDLYNYESCRNIEVKSVDRDLRQLSLFDGMFDGQNIITDQCMVTVTYLLTKTYEVEHEAEMTLTFYECGGEWYIYQQVVFSDSIYDYEEIIEEFGTH